MKATLKQVLAAAGIAVGANGLGACSQGVSAEPSAIVARVNETDITVTQLRAALHAKGTENPTAQEAGQALDTLVNEQLLADAALANNLDRDPAVVEALETARRQLLARAFVDRAVLPTQAISAADQTAYYRENPALFAQRRIYQLAAFTVATKDLNEGVIKKLEPARSPDGVALVLTSQRIEFQWQNLTRASEQVPLEQLPQFAGADVGDILIHPSDDRHTTLMLINGVQNAPLGFESAQPFIEQYLTNMRNAEAVNSHLRAARATATITHPDPSTLASPELATLGAESSAR